MALKVTPINVLGILDLGIWKRDCQTLLSVVIPPKAPHVPPNAPPPLPPNTFQGNVSGGLPGARLLALIPSGASGAPDEQTAQQRVADTLPGFSGAFQAQLTAEGFAEACGPDDTKQKVSWYYYIKLTVRGRTSSGVLALGGSFSLSLGPFGPGAEEECDCVPGAEPQLAYVPSANETEVAALIARTSLIPSAAAGPLLEEREGLAFQSSAVSIGPLAHAGSTAPFAMEVRYIDGELWGKLLRKPV